MVNANINFPGRPNLAALVGGIFAPDAIFVSDGLGDVYKLTSLDSSAATIAATATSIINATTIRGLDWDEANNKLCYNDAGTIKKCDPDGTNPSTIDAANYTWGLLYDPNSGVAGKFWTGDDALKEYDVDSGVDTDRFNAEPLNVGPGFVYQGEIYWANYDTLGQAGIYQATVGVTEGTKVYALLGGYRPYHCCLDIANDHVFITSHQGTIERVNFSTWDTETEIALCNGAGPRYIDIDLSRGKLWWTSETGKTLERCDLDGSNHETVWTHTQALFGLTLGKAA